jgi:hypothetical protein
MPMQMKREAKEKEDTLSTNPAEKNTMSRIKRDQNQNHKKAPLLNIHQGTKGRQGKIIINPHPTTN